MFVSVHKAGLESGAIEVIYIFSKISCMLHVGF